MVMGVGFGPIALELNQIEWKNWKKIRNWEGGMKWQHCNRPIWLLKIKKSEEKNMQHEIAFWAWPIMR